MGWIMKFQKILVVALFTVTISMQVYGDAVSAECPKCPPGSYRKNYNSQARGTCEACSYDEATKTLQCNCRSYVDGSWHYGTRKSGCSSYKNNDGELDCE
jgi:hypothetical protein